jgi:hypothetical protein
MEDIEIKYGPLIKDSYISQIMNNRSLHELKLKRKQASKF